MTEPADGPLCRSCRRHPAPDAVLCWHCTDQLEQAIAELPAHLYELNITATRQARMGGAGRVHDQDALAELLEGEREHRTVPARLRSSQGRIALPANPLPFAEHAATLARLASDALAQWVRLVAEARNLTPPAQHTARVAGATTRVVIRRNRALTVCHIAGTVTARPVTVQDRCTWLVAHMGEVRQIDAAVKMHRRFGQLARRIVAAVDRATPDQFRGRCTAKVLSVTEADGLEVLVPEVVECATDLYGHDDAPTVTCARCGADYDAARQMRILRGQVAEVWARAHTIANALTELDEPIRPGTLDVWISRDRAAVDAWRAGKRPEPSWPLVLQRGVDDAKRALYRVGDVQARIAYQRDRAARPTTKATTSA